MGQSSEQPPVWVGAWPGWWEGWAALLVTPVCARQGWGAGSVLHPGPPHLSSFLSSEEPRSTISAPKQASRLVWSCREECCPLYRTMSTRSGGSTACLS